MEMESSGSGAVECGVGSIVWVRRRNGSWWPGQILGPDELSASHLTSPRSGTPVKLLGREDASVDWYNLEKSKRVKAFRCGDFDDCIERAESSLGMPTKKREKYARREDAILHALELERQILNQQGKLVISSNRINKPTSAAKKRPLASPETSGNDSEKTDDGNELSGEEDNSEVAPRMRGLQDFGLKISPSKEKLLSSAATNGSQKLVDDGAQGLASGGLSMRSTGHANGKHILDKRKWSHEGLAKEWLNKRRAEQTGLVYQAKRSRCVYLPSESSDSFDYRDTPSQIEMSASQFGRHYPHPGSLFEEGTSGFMEDVESDSSETGSSESESDSSETELDTDEETTILSGVGQNAEEQGSTSSEEPDELAISGDMPLLYPRGPISSSEAVSKWQWKGKRNTRNLLKRPAGAPDGKGSSFWAYPEGKGSRFSQKALRPGSSFYRTDFTDSLDDADFSGKNFRPRMFGLYNGYNMTSGLMSKGRNKIHRNITDWDDEWTWEDQSALRGYWDMKGFTHVYDDRNYYGGRTRSTLVNVDLKVQASYQKEPVPIVSLMSKLDGKAIIGHPIQIEALQDGSSESLLCTVDEFGNDATDIEGDSVLPPAWRTARRTANFRVPRPHLSLSSNADGAEDIRFLDQGRKLDFKKLNTGSSRHKAGQTRKSVLSPRPSTDKKSLKKAPKKVNLLSSQKTRTLSSLAIEQNFSNKRIHDSNSFETDGMIKPEATGPTTVACIPVKLAFSRLLEKINRPPSKAASNAALFNTGVERNSS
ncbi:Tudor/PWWP/MBT superfamily protein [Quillaja saponaria]|uniref:Tudor/PWWP/MBT superfamily protein n=1 Tax=Quillaja saponaria TaxID=32244 RepID=A0AAD7L1L8_QUISA|nr:Tudor/PWWP/MBT superfamily protein [Quillaja saponaria]